MPVKIVDASALAAVLFAEPGAEKVAAELDGCRLAAPALLSFEIASVCLKKMRRHPAARTELVQALGRLPAIGVVEAAVDLDAAILLAERKCLSLYDAAYLWLADELGAELVTLDRRLATAART
jgi:predicted nucleic acid-binding protein